MVLCFDVLRKVVRTLSEQKNDLFVAGWISQRKSFGGGTFPQTRWFSGGKWGLSLMKRDFLSRFTITPYAGVRIETAYLVEKRGMSGSHPTRVCGLKHVAECEEKAQAVHTPRGCAD